MSERLAEGGHEGDRQPGHLRLRRCKEFAAFRRPQMQMSGPGPGHLVVTGDVLRHTFFVAPPSTRIFDPVM